jgi:hypothetical protein
MAAGLPAGSAFLAYPFSDMGLLMAVHGKKQKPNPRDSETEQRRRQIHDKMEQMGLDPEQRSFIEEMLDDEAPSDETSR